MTATAALDPTRCPLCGEPNQCAMEIERASGEKQPPCWCMAAGFDSAVLDRIPAPARGLACVCARCGRRRSAQ